MLLKIFTFLLCLFCLNISQLQAQDKNDLLLENKNVSDIVGKAEDLWIATNGNGVYNISNGKVVAYNTANGNLRQDFFHCIESNRDFVWAGSTDGLFIFDKRNKTWKRRKFAKGGQLSNWIRDVVYDEELKCLWIGRFQYLTKYDIRRRRYYDYDLTQNKNVKSNTINTISLDNNNNLWIGTEAGLHKIDKTGNLEKGADSKFFDNRFNFFNGEGKSISVADVICTPEYIWIGLDEFFTNDNPNYNLGGVYQFNGENIWEKFDKSDGFQSNGVFDMEYLGNYIAVSLYQFSPNTKKQYTTGISIINRYDGAIKNLNLNGSIGNINKIHFDGKYLWIGAEKGLKKINLYENKFSEFAGDI
jgi:ligand-binding sensor domain-containing protein